MPTPAEIGQELESFYRGYVDVFSRKDLDQVLTFFALPYGWVSGDGGLTPITNENDHRSGFSRLMLELKQRDWARSDIDLTKTWALADNLAMTLVDFTRYKRDGAVLEKTRACYTARHDGKSWRIVAISEIKSPFLGPGELPR